MKATKSNRKSRSTKKLMMFKLCIAAATLLSLEATARFAARRGLFTFRQYQEAVQAGEITFLGDINPHFGVWHVPNADVKVDTPAGPVSYQTNRHGMRDAPRSRHSDAAERVVVLGDSFVEGPYVEEADRLTDVAESSTGVEFLNFGTSGSFGSIQQWLLYKHLARSFDHSRVMVFHLPDNDFTDNDPREHSEQRYRPYLRKNGDAFELYYPVPFEEAPRHLSRMSPGTRVKHQFYNASYLLNFLSQIEFEQLEGLVEAQLAVSSYDTYSDEDLERLLYSYQQIVDLAKPRPVTFFIIPRDEDFLAYRRGHFEGRIVQDLQEFARDQENVSVVDLKPHFLRYLKKKNHPHSEFFLSFNPHWSPLGHDVAAQAVLESLNACPTWRSRAEALTAPENTIH